MIQRPDRIVVSQPAFRDHLRVDSPGCRSRACPSNLRQPSKTASCIRRRINVDNYKHLRRGDFVSGPRPQLDRNRLITTIIAVGHRRDRGLCHCATRLSGQASSRSSCSPDRDVSQDIPCDTLFRRCPRLNALQHLARADHPVHHFRVAAGHLHAFGVLPGDPMGPGEGGEDGRRHPVAGLSQSDRSAGRARASSPRRFWCSSSPGTTCSWQFR